MKQTSVDWLATQIDDLVPFIAVLGVVINDEMAKKFNELIQQAKEIHKKEIVDAVDKTNEKWRSQQVEVILNGNQYCFQTFKKTKNHKSMILQSMTDYVLEQNNKNIGKKYRDLDAFQKLFEVYSRIYNYANLLKQPLKLGMFIPCDENDAPLEEPLQEHYTDCTEEQNAKDWLYNLEKYQQAKERVLFKDFELVEIYRYGALLEMKFDDFSEKITILFEDAIEDLLTYSFDPEFELTDSAIKKYNLC